jgi:hypothetical protein
MIRRGMDSDLVVRRFRHDRQILASLNHPHIARLFDGGTLARRAARLALRQIHDTWCDTLELLSKPDRCPHCEGPDIDAMSESPSMQERVQTWYQCRKSQRFPALILARCQASAPLCHSEQPQPGPICYRRSANMRTKGWQ